MPRRPLVGQAFRPDMPWLLCDHEALHIKAQATRLRIELIKHVRRQAGLPGEDPEEAAIGRVHHAHSYGLSELPSPLDQ